MTDRVLTDDELQALEDVYQEVVTSGSFRTDYSGRGMYGDSCIGFTVYSFSEAAQVLVTLADTEDSSTGERWYDLADSLARALKTDDMGRGTIVYFPGVTAP